MLIPIEDLGHAFSFISNAQGLVSYGRKYCKNSNEPFTLTVGGETLYVITSPENVAATYKNNTTLSWDAMLDDLLVAFGVKPSVITTLWEKRHPSAAGDNRLELDSRTLSLVHSTLHLYKRQLLPGENLNSFSSVLLGFISESLCWERVKRQYGSATVHISLKELCGNVMVDSLTRALFGIEVLNIEPSLVQCLLDFNDDAWMLIFHYRQSSASKLHQARSKILRALTAYVQSPEQALTGRAWLIEKVMKEQEAAEIGYEDRAALLLMNIGPLLSSLRTETALAYQDNDINLAYLMGHCPQLDAVYHESLRVVNGALAARKIIAPTPMGTKVLRSGNTILIPLRQLHYDKAIFGGEPEKFEFDRFLNDKNLKNSPSFKPFGGGTAYCPGRFLAKQEMYYFVALFLNRFDVKLATEDSQGPAVMKPQKFPKLDVSTPALGVNGPVKGADVYVHLFEVGG
ncbi:MAG: hypothetical protein M1836_001778 [Candelina mexicana]|nr:MAG: hypothetical protein M1836_001778 [Candelina mexicana]